LRFTHPINRTSVSPTLAVRMEAEHLKARVVVVRQHAGDLEFSITTSTRLLIVNDPTGIVISPRGFERIDEVCQQRGV
jgi:aspartate/methionine/tyrosine aminotransferase